MHKLDVRGLACPHPVLAVKKAIDAGHNSMQVELDGGAPRDNVHRLANSKGFTVSETATDEGFILELNKK